MKGTFESLTE